jgi:HAD superfamily hydrolase (TIGR01457 family)
MKFKCFILDLDGVVYKGNELIEGADERISKIKKKAEVYFLTNNSTLSSEDYVAKLRKLGISAEEKEIITSGYAAAWYIRKNIPNPRAYVIGEEGLVKELRKQWIDVGHRNCNVVVVGLDRGFTYAKLAWAMKLILDGAEFIATNTDRRLITEKALLPGGGVIVKAVEEASGKKPIVVGKPSDIMAKIILEKVKAKPEEVLLIGDRLETDIAMGKKMGMKTALVLTGHTRREDVEKSSIKPDYILDKL